MKKALSLLLLFSLAVSPAEAGVYKSYVGKKINSSHVKKSSSTSRILKAGYGPTATFLKDYRRGRSIDADYAVGSKTGTITVTRNSGSPGTYVDDSGFVQNMPATNNTARFTSGFYSTSGFVSYPGILMEGASTNLITDSYFDRALGSDDWSGGTYSPTETQVSASSLIGISGANFIRWQKTFSGAESNNSQAGYWTSAAGAVSNGDVITVSFFVKGTVSLSGGGQLRTIVNILDSSNNYLQTIKTDTQLLTLNSSVPLRIQMTGTVSNASASKIRVEMFQMGASSKPQSGDSIDVYVTGTQIEKLPFASSFIPTTTAALTRNAESLSYPFSGNCNLVNSTGTILIKGTYLVDSTSASGFFFSRGTLNSRMYVQGGGGHPKCTAGDGDTSAASYTNVQGASLVQGFTFNGTNAIQYINGTADGVRNGYATSGLTNSQFFLGWNASSAATSVIISSIAIFSDANGSGDVANITNLINGNI